MPDVSSVDPAARMGLADHAIRDLDLRGQVEARVGLDDALFERSGDCERLEGRAGLVSKADGAILECPRGRLAEVVGIDLGPVRHREDRAAARVHDDRARALRTEVAADLAENLLGLVLDLGIERQPHRLAGRRGSHVLDLDRVAAAIVDRDALSVGPGKHAVA